eukprot:TRINITY_DN4658_c0_g3_i2.p3 TRINITY_DN4658_c0_g3~~TRINITY_DN4658_c0_g3_i2.p3  ORF type:complete len:130 (-),score=44.12 TRINITY_DN4658_c0_g3_i2:43-432(-)
MELELRERDLQKDDIEKEKQEKWEDEKREDEKREDERQEVVMREVENRPEISRDFGLHEKVSHERFVEPVSSDLERGEERIWERKETDSINTNTSDLDERERERSDRRRYLAQRENEMVDTGVGEENLK